MSMEPGQGAPTRAILHLDMDAFYVNVHLLEHPEDAGLPLAVGGRPDQRGVIASASYEARRFGVRSAMPSSTALRLCPELKIVGHTWSRIRDCSREVMAILADYGPVEKVSVDEAYVDLSDQPEPGSLAEDIRRRVKAETGLPASVGLATSKLVAKVASDHDKPEGCTVVPPGEEAAFLAPLPVRVIWGIGPRTAEQLAAKDIYTCGQLAEAKLAGLQALFGRHAEAMRRRARGEDKRPLVPERGPPKSISNEWTFDRDINDAETLRTYLEKMAASVGASLRRRGLLAKTVTVKFRWANFETFTRQKTVTHPMDSDEEIIRLAQTIWQENWQGQQMRLLGVGVSNLVSVEAQQLGFDF